MATTPRPTEIPRPIDTRDPEPLDRRTSGRIFELFARSTWLAFLLGSLLTEIVLYGLRRAAAGAIAPGPIEASIAALALGGALFEWTFPMAFCRQRRAPLASLAGATRDIASMRAWLAAAGALLAVAMRLTGHTMVLPLSIGLGASLVMWLLVKAHAWSHDALDHFARLRVGRRSIVRTLYPAARFWNAVTGALLRAIYIPVAYPAMLVARLLRMREEPLYYQCRLGTCKFRSADPAVTIFTRQASQSLEPVRTWPTVNAPLFLRRPRDGGRLVRTWHGLDKLEKAGHLRYNLSTDCRNHCRRSYGRRILVLGESGPELAGALAIVHDAAANRLTDLSPSARARGQAFRRAADDGRWGVTRRQVVSSHIDGRIPPREAEMRNTVAARSLAERVAQSVRIEIDVVSDFERNVWAPAYHGIVVLPMRASEEQPDHATYLASRLAQIKARQTRSGAAPGEQPRDRERDRWQRLFGPAERQDRPSGRAFSGTVVFLPGRRDTEKARMQAGSVRLVDETGLDRFMKEILE
jgi:hypothetical protein